MLTRSAVQRELFYDRMTDVVSSVQKPVVTKCAGCQGVLIVEPTEVKWKTLCDDCYEAHPHRKCQNCDRNLSLKSKKWTKLCTSCFLDKRQRTHAICPLCPPEFAKQLRRKINSPACKECLAFLKRVDAEENKENIPPPTPLVPEPTVVNVEPVDPIAGLSLDEIRDLIRERAKNKMKAKELQEERADLLAKTIHC